MKFIVVYKKTKNNYLIMECEKIQLLVINSNIELEIDFLYSTDHSIYNNSYTSQEEASKELINLIFDYNLLNFKLDGYSLKEIKGNYYSNIRISESKFIYLNDKPFGKVTDNKWLTINYSNNFQGGNQILKKSTRNGIRFLKDLNENVLRIFVKELPVPSEKKSTMKNKKENNASNEQLEIWDKNYKGRNEKSKEVVSNLLNREELKNQVSLLIDDSFQFNDTILKNQNLMLQMLKNIDLNVVKNLSNENEIIVNKLKSDLEYQKSINNQMQFYIKNLETEKASSEKRVMMRIEDKLKPISILLKNYDYFKEDDSDIGIRFSNLLKESINKLINISDEQKNELINNISINTRNFNSEIERVYIDMIFIRDNIKNLGDIHE